MFAIKDTLFIGKSFIELPIIASTNAYAQQLVSGSQPADGTIVSTFNQSEGKGYQNNVWLSKPNKNLSFSIILYPKFIEANQQFYLNMAVSIAIAEVLQEITTKEIVLKWPNDIYYLKRKLGGILIENSISGNSILNSVIGIGLNVNQVDFDKNIPNPSSLKLLTNSTFNLYNVLSRLVKAIEVKYLMLQNGKYIELTEQYISYLYALNESHTFKNATSNFIGKIRGIDEYGRLLIEDNGSMKSYHYKEIEYVFN